MKIPEPDFTFDSITEITPSWLKEHNISGVLMDVDGTLLPKKAAIVPEKVAKWLRTMGVNAFLGIVSNATMERIESVLDSVGNRYRMSRLEREHKPSGLGIKFLMKEMGLNPELTIYVGDKKKDIIAAHCAGIKSVKVKTMKKGETT